MKVETIEKQYEYLDEWFRGDNEHAFRNEAYRQDLTREEKKIFMNIMEKIYSVLSDNLKDIISSKTYGFIYNLIGLERMICNSYRLRDETFRSLIKNVSIVYAKEIIEECIKGKNNPYYPRSADQEFLCNLDKYCSKEIVDIMNMVMFDPILENEYGGPSIICDEYAEEIYNKVKYHFASQMYWCNKNDYKDFDPHNFTEKQLAVLIPAIACDFTRCSYFDTDIHDLYDFEDEVYDYNMYEPDPENDLGWDIESICYATEKGEEVMGKKISLKTYLDFMLENYRFEIVGPDNLYAGDGYYDYIKLHKIKAMKAACKAIKAHIMAKNGLNNVQIAAKLGYKSSSAVYTLLKTRPNLDDCIKEVRDIVSVYDDPKYVKLCKEALKFAGETL